MKPASATGRTPSIRTRLANALLVWSLAWGVAMAVAVWLTTGNEVDELLEDSLRSSAELLAALSGANAAANGAAANSAAGVAPPAAQLSSDDYAWQVVTADGRVELRSAVAPDTPWRATPSAGFSDVPGWRLYGLALGPDGRMLYAAQSHAERSETRDEVVLSTVIAALSIGLLGHFWLRARVRDETAALQTLSERVLAHDVSAPGATLGPAERSELEPVHAAIDQLTRELARRMATERAFSGHAAHALRTPLAGIDAQLAVALRECPESLRPRLQRVREAATRLQRVVAALLGLFRSGAEPPQRRSLALDALVSRLPIEGLDVKVDSGAALQADPDLLAAALLNLLDNAVRHGARNVTIEAPDMRTLRMRDDGPGIDATRLRELRGALAAQTYDAGTGLGLMLADRVARAHGGELLLPDAPEGFAVELRLGPG